MRARSIASTNSYFLRLVVIAIIVARVMYTSLGA
jgi:hypothetical protein